MSEIQRQVQLAKYYRNLRFLVIDDFENFRMSLRQMINGFGVEAIEIVGSGEDAVARCEEQDFDIILCDYNLGSGKNGQQVLEELRFNRLLKHTSIFVMVTAETSKDMVMGALEYLPDAYITKPLTKAVLQTRLDKLIEQREVLKPINTAIDEEQIEKAILLLDQEIKRDSRYILWCLRTTANLYFSKGDFPKARSIYEQVLSKKDIGWAKLGLGRVRIAQGEYQEAVADFKGLLDHNPNLIEAYDNLANAYLKLGLRKEAQSTLKDAASISPHAILRQKKLAEVSNENQDYEGAAEAFKSTMRLGFNSVHDAPENYINLGRCLAELAEGDKSDIGKSRAKDAIHAMDRVSKKFKDNNSIRMNAALIEARAHLGQGDVTRSKSAFAKAEKVMNIEEADAETSIEFARTLYCMGEEEKAERLLKSLAASNKDDKKVIKSINELIDEPVSLQLKVRARKLNKDGIRCFETGDLDSALESFNEALEATPKHPALNLNVIQVTLKKMAVNGQDEQAKQLCLRCLANVSHIPEQHPQYKRYVYLQNKLSVL